MRPAIRVDNLSKQYRIGTRQRSAQPDLRETITEGVTGLWRRLRGGNGTARAEAPPESEFWALKDVSFEVQPGEVVGIIGRNGAGKSTLLKILSRIVEPTSGRAEVRGRMGSLLEVGTGFHAELTGRENIYLNGSILGMSRKEINRKFDEIVDFSEIEQFIDTPVKRYSSGMYVRLAFAVASQLEPDILLLDEVLAVGDTAFQSKCLGKMGEVSRAGRTVIFVSHNMHAVNVLCPRSIFLRNGEIYRAGPSTDVIRHYLEAKADQTAEAFWEGDARPGNDIARLSSVRVLTAQKEVRLDHDIAEPIHLAMEVSVLQPGVCVDVSFHVINKDGLCLFAVGAPLTPEQPGQVTPPGRYRSVCEIPAHFLNDGKHYVSAFLVRNKADIFVNLSEVVSFMAHDYGTGRGGYMGTFIGAIRPHLPWSALETCNEGGHPVRRPGDALARGNGIPAQTVDRDRRPADPLAHHEDLFRLWIQAVRPVPGIQGLAPERILLELQGVQQRFHPAARLRPRRGVSPTRQRRLHQRGGLADHVCRDRSEHDDRRPREEGRPLS